MSSSDALDDSPKRKRRRNIRTRFQWKQINEKSNCQLSQNDQHGTSTAVLDLITRESMDSLTDDALLYIFKNLDLRLRVRLEKVCKRWRLILLRSWQSVQTLELSKILTKGMVIENGNENRVNLLYMKRAVEADDAVLRSIMGRCGTNLSLITFGGCRPVRFTLTLMRNFVRFCSNLVHLDLEGMTLTSRAVTALANCLNLNWLSLKNCYNYQFLSTQTSKTKRMDLKNHDKHLGIALENLTKLKFLNLFGSKQLEGECLLKINLSLESLILDYCTSMNVVFIEKFCQTHPHLGLFSQNNCTSWPLRNVPVILADNCANSLTELELNDFNWLFSSGDRSLVAIGRLINLKRLLLNENALFRDEELIAITSNCPLLECFHIQHANVKSVTLKLIRKLHNLQELNLSRISSLDDDILSYISEGLTQLRKLYISRCRMLTDAIFANLGTNCSLLEELSIYCCRYITNHGIELFAQSIQLNGEKSAPIEKVMKIWAYHTGVKSATVLLNERWPNLCVDVLNKPSHYKDSSKSFNRFGSSGLMFNMHDEFVSSSSLGDSSELSSIEDEMDDDDDVYSNFNFWNNSDSSIESSDEDNISGINNNNCCLM